MMHQRSWFVAGLLSAVLAGPAQGVAPETWSTTGVDGWTLTLREGLALDSEGRVRLSLSGKPAEGFQAFTVWDLLPDGSGVLAATGDGGVVYRIGADGTAVPAATVVQPEVTALGRTAEGHVLFGAAPDGMLYRLRGEQAEPVADTPESYIWGILPRGRSGAWILTGNDAAVYVLDGSALTRLAKINAVHVTGAIDAGDHLLLTTDSPGQLLSVDTGSGETRVLYEAAQPELRSPLRTADGSLYCLANPESGNGSVLRLLPSGGVETVWTSANGIVFDLLDGGDGSLIVAAGSETGQGALVRLQPGPPSAWSEFLTVDAPQPACLAQVGSTLWVGTGGVGTVLRAVDSAGSGTVTSDVRDAGGTASWGALSLLPGTLGDGLRVETRSGNTLIPGESWSSWQPVSLNGGRGLVASPAARFLQWKLTLGTSSAVSAVSVTYLPANLPPRVNELTISALGASMERSLDGSAPSALSQTLSGGARVDFQLPGYRGTTEATDEQAAWARRFRTLSWKGDDPNRDPLRYRVELRPESSESWQEIGKDLEGTVWVWDSSAVPDGWYRVRVTASDAGANPEPVAGSGNRVSEPFLVDNTAPRILNLSVSGDHVEGVARDETSTVRSLSYAVNGGVWNRVFPVDGIPDMPEERFRISLQALDPGEHIVLIRAVDEAGNLGSGRLSVKRP